MNALASLTPTRVAASGVVLVVALAACALWVVAGLPPRVPVHWTLGSDGGLVVDRWMARETVRLLVVAAAVSAASVVVAVAYAVRAFGN